MFSRWDWVSDITRLAPGFCFADFNDAMKKGRERVRRALCEKRGNDVRRFVYSKNVAVRKLVAQFGTDAEKALLIADESASVRCVLAVHGSETVQKALLDDTKQKVRIALARHGSENIRTKLLKDDSRAVRLTAQRRRRWGIASAALTLIFS